MQNKEKTTIIKNEDGTIKTIQTNGSITSTTITDKHGKAIAFSTMIIGKSKDVIIDEIKKEMETVELSIEKPQTKEKVQNIENSVTILPIEKHAKNIKKNFKKHQNKRTKQNLFYKNNNEKTL